MSNRRFHFEWGFKNFKIRTRHEDWGNKNSPLHKNMPVELIKYLDDKHDSCYTVAYFHLDAEGYELHFVGNRPMNDISAEEMASIWVQLQAAQKMLDAYYIACEEGEEFNEYN